MMNDDWLMSPAAKIVHYDELSRQRMEREIRNEIRRVRHAKLREQEKTRRIAAIEVLGDDVYENGEVTLFTKQYKPDGHAFTYIALKIGDAWYVTGRSEKYTWDELVEFLALTGEPTSQLRRIWLIPSA